MNQVPLRCVCWGEGVETKERKGGEVKPWEKNGTPWPLLGLTARCTGAGGRESWGGQAASHARGCPASSPPRLSFRGRGPQGALAMRPLIIPKCKCQPKTARTEVAGLGHKPRSRRSGVLGLLLGSILALSPKVWSLCLLWPGLACLWACAPASV